MSSPDTTIRMLEAYRFGERLVPERKQFTWSTLFDRDLSGKPANG